MYINCTKIIGILIEEIKYRFAYNGQEGSVRQWKFSKAYSTTKLRDVWRANMGYTVGTVNWSN